MPEPADRIGELRTEIDACDAQIIELVQRRLAISQEIGVLRTSIGGTRLSLSREQQVLSRFPHRAGAGRRLPRHDAAPPGPRPALSTEPLPARSRRGPLGDLGSAR